LTIVPPFAYNKPSYLLAGLPAVAPVAGERPKNRRGIDERAAGSLKTATAGLPWRGIAAKPLSFLLV
jgi:hypothetical protein